MRSKSEPVAPKKAPNVVSGPGPWSTKILLPPGAGVTVQPVKSPVSKSPLIMRFWAEAGGAVAASRRPMERNVAMHLSGVSGFMIFAFLFPAELVFAFARPEEAKNNSGGIVLHLIQMRLAALF